MIRVYKSKEFFWTFILVDLINPSLVALYHLRILIGQLCAVSQDYRNFAAHMDTNSTPQRIQKFVERCPINVLKS